MREVVFEGNSLSVIRQFPDDARHRAGYEIDRVQRNLEPENWKPFASIGQGVREICIQVGEQYRVIYVVKVVGKVHVLHAFQKKTQKTRQSDIELAKSRFKELNNRIK